MSSRVNENGWRMYVNGRRVCRFDDGMDKVETDSNTGSVNKSGSRLTLSRRAWTDLGEC